MAACPPPDSPPPARRRKRRWLRRLLWGTGLGVLLLWMVKVPLLNWQLRRLPGDFEVSITGISPGFWGSKLAGVKVIHRPTGRLVAYAAAVEVTNGLGQCINGHLGHLIITKPEVNWHPEYWTPEDIPLIFGPAPSALVTWDSGEIHDGVFSWYERGHEVPRLSLKATRITGGKFTVYNDGRCEGTSQNAVLDELVSREYTLGGTLEIVTRSPHAEGVVTARRKDNLYIAESLKLSAPELHMVWRRGEPIPAALPEIPAPPRPDWDKPAEFLIKDGISDPGRAMFTIHSPNLAPVEFSAALTHVHTAGLRAGSGRPCVIPLGEASFASLKSPGSGVEAKEFSFAASLDEQAQIHVASAAVNDVSVPDSNRLLAAIGCSQEQLRDLPVCKAVVDAKGGNLLISKDGVSSSDPQQIVLNNFSAVMPGKKDPVAVIPHVELTAVPDEAFSSKRLRSVVADKPDLQIDRAGLPSFAKTTPATPPGASPALDTGKPGWFGWHTDSLTVNDGRVKASGLGFGVPVVSGVFDAKTEPSNLPGGSLYHFHISHISMANPLVPIVPLQSKRTMEVTVHPLRFWDKGSYEEILIDGEKVELHQVFLKLFKTGDKASSPSEEPAAQETPRSERSGASCLPPQRVRRLPISNSEIAVVV